MTGHVPGPLHKIYIHIIYLQKLNILQRYIQSKVADQSELKNLKIYTHTIYLQKPNILQRFIQGKVAGQSEGLLRQPIGAREPQFLYHTH